MEGVTGTGHLLTKLDQTLPHFLDISMLTLAFRETPHQTESLGPENRDIFGVLEHSSLFGRYEVLE
jgi:hypothetical protein